MTGWAGEKRRSDRTLVPQPRKRRFRMRQIKQLYLSPQRKTIPVGGFQPLRPKCHTTVVTPTKMECCAMIIIDKGPNKGLLFERVFYSVQNFYHRKSIQPHDGWITNPVTRWFHHTVGFFFFTTITFKDLVYVQSSSLWYRLLVSLSRGFFLFYHEPYQPQRINKGGSPFRPPPWAKSLILTVPGLGLSPQRHTYGSESVSMVQGLVYDLNVYKTHGEWLSQWNLTTWDTLKMQWVFSFLPRPTDKYPRVL